MVRIVDNQAKYGYLEHYAEESRYQNRSAQSFIAPQRVEQQYTDKADITCDCFDGQSHYSVIYCGDGGSGAQYSGRSVYDFSPTIKNIDDDTLTGIDLTQRCEKRSLYRS